MSYDESQTPHSMVQLIPTEGCHQKTKVALLMRETLTTWVVSVPGEYAYRKFRKRDGFEVRGEFPRYRIELPNENLDFH